MAGAAALAALLRLLPGSSVFTSEGALLWDGDSYYHMRRVAHALQHFPDFLFFDPYLDYPRGTEPHWPPGFDWTLAAILRPFVGDDVAAAERWAAVVPVVFASLAVVALAFVGRRLAGPTAGVAAAFGLAVLPASYSYTRLGFFDHHAAVTLLVTLVLGGVLTLVRWRDVGPRLWPLFAGALVAANLYVWPGSLVLLVLAQAGALVWTLGAATRDTAVARAGRLAAAHALAAGLVALYGYGRSFLGWGSFTPLDLTSFQPVYFACAALTLGGSALAWRRTRFGAGLPSRVGIAIGVGACVLVATFVAIPELRASLLRSTDWFAGDERFHSLVAELEPLLGAGTSQPERGARFFSPLLFAFPLAWFVLVMSDRRDPARLMLAAWSLVFGVMTLTQLRFMNSFAVAFSLVWAVAFVDIARKLAERGIARRSIGIGAAVAVGLAAIPVYGYYRDEAAKFARSADDTRAVHFRRAARYLAEHTPPAEGPDGTLDYGVLAAWGYGHQVRYYAGRPVLQDNFGIYGGAQQNMDDADRYFAAETEARALAILDRLRLRYIIADRWGSGVPVATPPRSMIRRLVGLRGSQARLGEGPDAPVVPALSRHRLIYESAGSDGPLRVFERVAGARVEGSATPGAGVIADLALRTGEGGFGFRTSTRADARGRYRLVVPYPTVDWGAAATPEGAYRLYSEGEYFSLDVSEAAVVQGQRVDGPDFAPPEAAN
ncbi:MAG: STT3 domain-containing protein [Myxococcota bacterium]